jgi:methionyl-tRNA formyltransferase
MDNAGKGVRVLFIGGTKRGYLTLKAFLDGKAHVVGIISLRQDEHETDRYEKHIQRLAEDFKIPLYETKFLKDRDYAGIISSELKPDIAYVVGCRIMIPAEIYGIPPLGALAVHDSMLPEYRGFAPLNWSIINGEDLTGVTLFYLDDHMDGGDIVKQKAVTIGKDDTAPEVYERVCQATIDVIMESLDAFSNGTAFRIEQDYSAGSFTCSRIPSDGMIDWKDSTEVIYNKVRALIHPYPGAFTYYKGKVLKIGRAGQIDNPRVYKGRIPGRVIGFSKHEGYVDVLTGDGILRIFEAGYDGGELKSASEIITSVRVSLGIHIKDVMERIDSLENMVIDLQKKIEPLKGS